MYLVAAGPFLACHDELLRACEYSQQMWTAILCSSTPVLHRLDRRPLDDAPSRTGARCGPVCYSGPTGVITCTPFAG